MVKRLLLLTILFSFLQITAGFSQITIGTVDPGPYTPGSSIAVTFSLGSDCMDKNSNKFELYLSDASGNFISTTPIGSYTGFYSTFVNGTIPNGTPAGTGYKLRIKSTNPVYTSDSAPFTITTGTAVNAKLTSASTISSDPVIFGACDTDPGQTSTPFIFKNESSSANTTVTIINELDPGAPSIITFNSIDEAKVFTAALAHYTMIVKSTANGTIGTTAYFLVNNLAVTAFTTTSGNTVCFPVGAFEYLVNTGRNGGIKDNFPGNTYSITWGDGSTSIYTYCEILKQSSKVSHIYSRSSCGLTYTSGTETTYNAFGINVGVLSPFCGKVGSPLSTAARVVSRPENIFTAPDIACLGNVTFINTSTAGQKAGTTSSGCSPNTVLYTWNIDGTDVASNIPFSNYTYNFTTKGTHTIRLTSISNGTCQADPVEVTICIQDPPKPNFTLPTNTICLTSGTITPANTSIIDNTCPGAVPIYTWTVTPGADVTYVGGTNSHSPVPQFKFLKIGTYNITLNIQSATCQATTLAQQVVVDGEPQATLSGEAKLCQIGQLTFGPGATTTATTISGNVVDLSDTYTWEVSGGAYNFVAPSTVNSKYPVINFTEYNAYTVKLTYKNKCNTITRTQVITFYQSPVPKITAIANPICYNNAVDLQGNITNTTPQTTYQWIGAPGGVFSNPLSLTTTYTPTVAERDAGTAHIRLVVNTGLSGACAQVEDAIDVTITPNNTSTNPIPTRTKSICTGDLATFTPTSVVTGSTFTWVATNADGFATGFTPNGSGNINEAITNNSPTQNAVVVYTITPATATCTGVPFTLTVTVTPKPILTPIPDKTICSGNSAALTVASNIQTQFIWTSVATNGITGNSNPSGLSAASGSITINDVLSNPSFTQGTVTYTIKSFSASSTGCEGNTVTIIVTVDPKVTQANAGPDDSICATGTSSTYTLKGNKPDVGTGEWKLISTHAVLPNITTPTNFETTVTGLVVGDPYIFEWAITGAGKCANTSARVKITVTPLPVISTPVLDKTICQNNSADIAITSDILTQFKWTSSATTGTTGNSNPTTSSPASNTITINDVLLNSTYTQGEVTYTVTPYSVTGCPGSPITIVVKVDPAVTTATAGANTSICNTTTYDLEGSEPKVGTGLWELVSATAGKPPVTITTPTNFKTSVTGLEAGGVYTFRWTITGTGKCQESYADVTITVNMPTVPGTTATPQTLVCQNNNTGTITLSGNTGSVLSWQSSTDGSTWINIPGTNTGQTYTFNNLNTDTQFRAVVQNAGCTIGYSTATAITVAPATTIADAGPDQTLCAETSVLLKGIAVKSGETGLWTMVSGDANAIITAATNNETSVTSLAPNVTYVFKWTITGNSPCGPTIKEVTIRNNRAIDLNSLTSTAAVCNGQQVVINGSVPIGGEEGHYNYVWESKLDAGAWNVITGEVGKDLTITLTTTGTVSFRRIVNSGTCTSTSNEFPITVQPPITGNTIRDNQPICSGIRPMPITGDLPTGGDGNFSYQWQSSLNGTTWTDINGVISPDFQPQILTGTTYYRRIVSTLECSGALKSISNTVTITVTPNAKAEFTWGTNDQGCYPFALPIQVVTHPDRNNTYTWYKDNDIIGTSSAFPGYTIRNSGQSVTIKLVVTSSRGCFTDSLSHTFSTNQAVPASFDQSTTEGCGPLQVNFTNTSLLIPGARFEWYVGSVLFSKDVHPPTLTLQPDPTGKDSTYVIKLKAITDCGIDSVTKTVFVKAKPVAVVTPDKVEVCSPYKITFTNTSPGGTNTYYYDFGDGSDIEERTDKLPIDHIYNVAATTEFTFKMTAKNECGVDTMKWTIRVFPQNMTPVLGVRLEEIRGCAPHTVNFENHSIGASRFEFDFGDGNKQTTYTAGIVPHTYTSSGNFTVTMIAFNICSKMTVTKSVEVLPQPVADFEADNTLGCPGLVVKFKNKTQGGLDNKYLWDFGDGTSSAEFEPEHTYTGNQEYYTVKLLATNQLGCPIEVTKNQYIHVVPPPIAAFNVNPSTLISIPNYTFKFEDESTNTPTIWQWDFGDKVGTSQLKNPSYTYLDTGTYKVTLKVINQNGCFTTTFKNVTIKGVPGYLFVPNSFIPGNTQPELREFRAKGSGIASWRFSVFNKWGQILWETTKLDEGRPAEAWDGTFKGQPMPQGVYYWKIDVQMINGTEWKGMTYDKSAPKRTGAIHLIR